MIKLTLILLVCFFFCSCQEKDHKEYELSIPKSIKFLGHKGSGPIGKNGNNSLIENSWKSIENAVNSLDGTEIDIQMSADSTLWVFHDHELLDCNNQNVNIGDCSDQKIDSISKCQYRNEMLTFEEFINRSSLQKWSDKTISLDLKVLYNPVHLSRFSSGEELAKYVIEKLKHQIANSTFQVLFEVPTREQYNLFNESFKGLVYLVDHAPSVDFLKKEKERNTNLSLPLHELSETNDFFKDQNLQLWTINSPNDFFSSLKYNPTFIQSDNIPMMRFFRIIQNGAEIYHSHPETYVVGNVIAEFYPLVKRELPKYATLVEINSTEKEFPDQLLLTFSVFDSNDEPVHWEGYDLGVLDHSYIFIDPDFLSKKNGYKFAIGIWNKSILKFQGEFQLDFFNLEDN